MAAQREPGLRSRISEPEQSRLAAAVAESFVATRATASAASAELAGRLGLDEQ